MCTVHYKKIYPRLLAIVLVGLLFAGLSGMLIPAGTPAQAQEPAGAGEIVLEITGEGVTTPLSFTLPELELMEQYAQLYSTINSWPTKRWYLARGVKLRELLSLAGIKEEATLIKFTGIDNYEWNLTVKELLIDKRYYFPGLKENDPSDGSIPGSSHGKQGVEPVIALAAAEEGASQEDLDDRDGLMLIMGQRAVTEQTWLLFVKHLRKIEVLNLAPEKWDAPQINVPDGVALPLGTRLRPENKDTDADKIYYTTDGSTPTVDSPMFNWSAKRWWDQREDVDHINIPIEVVKEMVSEGLYGQDVVVLKLKTIGPGRQDSEVATYTFYIDPDAEDPTKITGGPPAGIVLDRNRIDLKIGGAYQLAATVFPYNAPDKRITWHSSDTRAATVNNSGLVTAVGPGAALITATTVVGNHSAVCSVNSPALEEAEQVVAPAEVNLPEEEEPEEPAPAEPEADQENTAEENAPAVPPAAAVPSGRPPGTSAGLPWGELPADALPPVESGKQYLAEKKELPVAPAADPAVEQTDSRLEQIFEMSISTVPVPFSLQKETRRLQMYLLAIFVILFLSGAAPKIAEYTKEQ